MQHYIALVLIGIGLVAGAASADYIGTRPATTCEADYE